MSVVVSGNLGADPLGRPWLDLIISGDKSYEGRLNHGKWKKVSVGNIIEFHDQTGKASKTVQRVIVTSRNEYDTFREAWIRYGFQLLPIPGITVDDAEILYMGIGNYQDVLENLPKGSRVLILGFDLVESPEVIGA